MMRGELTKVTSALHKIAEVEEKINNLEVWDAIGPNGIETVDILQEAIKELATVVLDQVESSIRLRSKTEA